jgi:putative phage-type endonuclease
MGFGPVTNVCKFGMTQESKLQNGGNQMKILADKTGWTEEQWQDFRSKQKQIGGSDVSIILGLNPFKTAFTLWLEKTGQIEPEPVSNEYVEWGNILEPIIREKFQRETGFQVDVNNYVMAHDEFPFMVANIDGEVIDDLHDGKAGVLEIKTARERYKKDWEEGPPLYYMCQIQHYLAVMGYEYAYCAVLLGGSTFRYFLIERDDYIIDQIISAEMEFWNMVENNIAPEIDGSEQVSKWLGQKYPADNGHEMPMTGLHEAMAHEYLRLTSLIKEMSAEADAIKNKIKHDAEDYRSLIGSNIKVSLPTISKIMFDSKRFASDHPELYESYKTKESTYRNFTVKFLN